MKLSSRLDLFAEPETLKMAKLGRELRSQGIDVIDLSLGEPDFDTPEHIKESLKKAVDEYIDVPGRCRLSVLPAGEHVQWHCHGYLHTLPLLTEVVLHMPIQSINVSARVADSNYNKVYNSKFNEGELWFLNTWLPHSFDNQGPLDRYHLWMNTYLTNEAGESVNLKLNSLLEDALYDASLVGENTTYEWQDPTNGIGGTL